MTSGPNRPRRQPSSHRRGPRPAGPTNPEFHTPPDEVYFAIGRIVAPHGVRGEVKMEILTDRPERIAELRRVYFNDDPTPVTLSSARMTPKQVLLKFPDINDRDAAADLRGTIVRVAGNQLPPQEEDAYYHYQLIDLDVFDDSGTRLGKLAQILEAGEVDVYIVRDEHGKEQLFPALKEVVIDINLETGRITVRPLEWDDEPDEKLSLD